MSLILFIETTAEVCSVGLCENKIWIAEENCFEPNSHSTQLHPLIKTLMSTANKTMGELSAVAVSVGPGSYTGLRVGVAAAKGFCMALNIPFIAINTLSAMCNGFISNHKPINENLFCPIIDARRNEVFAALYAIDGKEIIAPSNFIVDENFFSRYKIQNILFFGNGSFKINPLQNNRWHIWPELFKPLAHHMFQLAIQKFELLEFENIASFEPSYLKPVYITKSKK